MNGEAFVKGKCFLSLKQHQTLPGRAEIDRFSKAIPNGILLKINRNIGIKHGFSCISIRQVPKAAVFNTSQGTWRMLMH